MIGIFDSGVGGMTVARAVEQFLPGYPILYLGDIARTPYGTKSADTIVEYSRRNVRFLLERGATLIVIACNTASSVATEILRREFATPIFEVISPAVAEAAQASVSGRIGVIGTGATVRSAMYEKLLRQARPGCRVFQKACPLLVPLVEEGWLNRQETKMIVRRYLHPLKDQRIDTLVLGCTHYPLLASLIQPRIGKKTRLIDSSLAAASFLKKTLNDNATLAQSLNIGGENRFFVTDRTESVQKIAETIFHRPMTLDLV
ncbi:MAG: glutamate racemase [Desulfobulbaceae bacterium]|jgi:glutamate racemase|nr:glutamate racemase [Desulfobulbaceae bacterium]